MICYHCGRKFDKDSHLICPACGTDNHITTDLLKKAQDGDREARTSLYLRTEKNLRNYICTLTNDYSLMDDFVQETYLKAYEKLNQVRTGSGFYSWLKKVAETTVMDYYRKNASSMQVHLEVLSTESINYARNHGNSNQDPAEVLIKAERDGSLKDMIRSLTKAQQEVFLLRFSEEKSIRETAEILGISEHAVKRRVEQGRKTLRKKVNDQGIRVNSNGSIPMILFLAEVIGKGAGKKTGGLFTGKQTGVIIGKAAAALMGGFLIYLAVSIWPDRQILKEETQDIDLHYLEESSTMPESQDPSEEIVLTKGTEDESRELTETGSPESEDEFLKATIPEEPEGEIFTEMSETETSESSVENADPTVTSEISESSATAEPSESAAESSQPVSEPSEATEEPSESAERSQETSAEIEETESSETDTETSEASSDAEEETSESVSVSEESGTSEMTSENEEVSSETENPENTSEAEASESEEASSEETSGNCGNKVSYEIQETETGQGHRIIFTGSGAIYDYGNELVPWNEYKGTITEVLMDPEITSIGTGAFRNCKNIASVVFPENLETIGDYAFDGCTSLTEVIVPEGAKSVGSYAFSNCASLKEVTLPETISSLGQCVFRGCTSLNKAVINGNISELPYASFYGCNSLTAVSLTDSIRKIGNYAFNNCSELKKIDLPESLIDVGLFAFSGCSSLTALVLPDHTESLGISAFSNCTSLTSVTFDQDMKTIESNCFVGSALTGSIMLYDQVSYIGNGAFSGRSTIDEFYIPESLKSFDLSVFISSSGIRLIRKLYIPGNVSEIISPDNGLIWKNYIEEIITDSLDSAAAAFSEEADILLSIQP